MKDEIKFRRGFWVVILLIALMSAACPKAPLQHETGDHSFTPPPAEWTPLKGEDGVLLFKRKSPEMGITLQKLCNRYQSAPLQPLARNLFIGFEDREVVERGDIKVAGIDAFYIVMDCTLEGTPLRVKTYTLKANNCIYDLAYFASPGNFNKGLATFEEFVQSFRAQ